MTSEGISAGLKVGLFFLLGFVLLGEPIGFSLFLAILGGLAGGWIAAGLNSTETPSLPVPPTSEPIREESGSKDTKSRVSTTQRFQSHHKKRPPHVPKPSIFFWKNARPSKGKPRR